MGNWEMWLNLATVVSLFAALFGWHGAGKRAEELQQALDAEMKAHESTRETLRATYVRPRKTVAKRAGIIEAQRA